MRSRKKNPNLFQLEEELTLAVDDLTLAHQVGKNTWENALEKNTWKMHFTTHVEKCIENAWKNALKTRGKMPN